MNLRPFRLAAMLVACLGLALPGPVLADSDGDEDGDHDLARELYEHGEIHALYEIMRQVQAETGGEIVGVDLIRDGTRWLYRFQVVTEGGHRRVVDIDASQPDHAEND
jgi:uncharacterized membrane protein YkoI